jgi:t-SNARE complex subunit (syntaxin)
MNRINDLKKNRKHTYEVDIEEETQETPQKRGDGVDGTEKGSMEEFFKIIEIVKKNIVNIDNSKTQVDEINQKLELSTTEEEETQAGEGLQKVIISGNKSAKNAQALLKDLNREVQQSEQSHIKPSELKIRKNLIQTLTKKYIDVLKIYQDSQNKFKEIKKKRAVKRIKQVKPDATPEEIEAVLQSGGATNFAKQTILQGDASEIIKNALENVNSKYQDVLKLEASVAELAQMFQDFALVVEKQGELLDKIEYQVKGATEYVEEGNKETAQAITYLISARKKQACICAIVLIIIIIVVAVVASKVSGG